MAKKKKTPAEKAKQLNFWQQISINRRLDIFGAAITLLGLLTFLTLTSITHSGITDGWASFLTRAFGWGKWAFPITLFVVGIWLIARNQENIPKISIERVTGIALLFLWALGILQLFTVDPVYDVAFVDGMIGGGYFGALFMRTLWSNLGVLGTAVIFIAWLLIALTLTMDTSVQGFFQLISPPFVFFYEVWRDWIKEKLAPFFIQKKTPPIRMDGYNVPQDKRPAAEEPRVQIGVRADEARIEWQLPIIGDILDEGIPPTLDEDFIDRRAKLIEETLDSFGAPVKIVEINRGPTITQFGVEPGFIETRKGKTRVRVNKISALADDLALALAASRIRIQAPVPGKGYVGIEVPNEEMTLVNLRDILENKVFDPEKMPLGFPLGRDVAGYPKVANLTEMPHLLIAGTTGSGKSVCINAILTSMLINNTPDELRLVLVDPKRVELTGYNGIPHLLSPVVVETEKVVGALQWMTREMDRRYHEFSKFGARNIADYNTQAESRQSKKLPYLMIVIDELADLMMIAPTETESTITRLAQLARATGIHMILATQRPSTDVVTGLIKANFPARIAFAVASGTDSRVILDQSGAERLLGRGDMLYQAPDAPAPLRLQGVFVSDEETERLVRFWQMQAGNFNSEQEAHYSPGERLPNGVPLKQVDMFEEMQRAQDIDPLYDEAIDIVRRQGRASVSMLQRRLRIGYTRASRLVDMMEDDGIVSPPTGGTGVRDVLDYGKAAPPAEG